MLRAICFRKRGRGERLKDWISGLIFFGAIALVIGFYVVYIDPEINKILTWLDKVFGIPPKEKKEEKEKKRVLRNE
jgi:hypothetical protein